MTQKAKLEQFDAIKAERDKLALAIYDLTCNTKFPFGRRVTVNGAKERVLVSAVIIKPKQGIKEVRRHAGVSTDNAHACVECFCCACGAYLEETEQA